MTLKGFYKGALLLPLGLPAIAGAIGGMFLAFPDSGISDEIGRFFLIIGWTGIFSTVPMVLLAGVILVRNKKRPFTASEARRLLWKGPLYATFPTAFVLSLRGAVSQGVESGFADFVLVSFFGLILGYSYVLLIELARFVAVGIGTISDIRTDAALGE